MKNTKENPQLKICENIKNVATKGLFPGINPNITPKEIGTMLGNVGRSRLEKIIANKATKDLFMIYGALIGKYKNDAGGKMNDMIFKPNYLSIRGQNINATITNIENKIKAVHKPNDKKWRVLFDLLDEFKNEPELLEMLNNLGVKNPRTTVETMVRIASLRAAINREKIDIDTTTIKDRNNAYVEEISDTKSIRDTEDTKDTKDTKDIQYIEEEILAFFREEERVREKEEEEERVVENKMEESNADRELELAIKRESLKKEMINEMNIIWQMIEDLKSLANETSDVEELENWANKTMQVVESTDAYEELIDQMREKGIEIDRKIEQVKLKRSDLEKEIMEKMHAVGENIETLRALAGETKEVESAMKWINEAKEKMTSGIMGLIEMAHMATDIDAEEKNIDIYINNAKKQLEAEKEMANEMDAVEKKIVGLQQLAGEAEDVQRLASWAKEMRQKIANAEHAGWMNEVKEAEIKIDKEIEEVKLKRSDLEKEIMEKIASLGGNIEELRALAGETKEVESAMKWINEAKEKMTSGIMGLIEMAHMATDIDAEEKNIDIYINNAKKQLEAEKEMANEMDAVEKKIVGLQQLAGKTEDMRHLIRWARKMRQKIANTEYAEWMNGVKDAGIKIDMEIEEVKMQRSDLEKEIIEKMAAIDKYTKELKSLAGEIKEVESEIKWINEAKEKMAAGMSLIEMESMRDAAIAHEIDMRTVVTWWEWADKSIIDKINVIEEKIEKFKKLVGDKNMEELAGFVEWTRKMKEAAGEAKIYHDVYTEWMTQADTKEKEIEEGIKQLEAEKERSKLEKEKLEKEKLEKEKLEKEKQSLEREKEKLEKKIMEKMHAVGKNIEKLRALERETEEVESAIKWINEAKEKMTAGIGLAEMIHIAEDMDTKERNISIDVNNAKRELREQMKEKMNQMGKMISRLGNFLGIASDDIGELRKWQIKMMKAIGNTEIYKEWMIEVGAKEKEIEESIKQLEAEKEINKSKEEMLDAVEKKIAELEKLAGKTGDALLLAIWAKEARQKIGNADLHTEWMNKVKEKETEIDGKIEEVNTKRSVMKEDIAEKMAAIDEYTKELKTLVGKTKEVESEIKWTEDAKKKMAAGMSLIEMESMRHTIISYESKIYWWMYTNKSMMKTMNVIEKKIEKFKKLAEDKDMEELTEFVGWTREMKKAIEEVKIDDDVYTEWMTQADTKEKEIEEGIKQLEAEKERSKLEKEKQLEAEKERSKLRREMTNEMGAVEKKIAELEKLAGNTEDAQRLASWAKEMRQKIANAEYAGWMNEVKEAKIKIDGKIEQVKMQRSDLEKEITEKIASLGRNIEKLQALVGETKEVESAIDWINEAKEKMTSGRMGLIEMAHMASDIDAEEKNIDIYINNAKEQLEAEKERSKLEKEKLERERQIEKEKEKEKQIEKERLEKEKQIEKERLEKEKQIEKERLEKEKQIEKEKEKEKQIEKERLEKEKLEKEKDNDKRERWKKRREEQDAKEKKERLDKKRAAEEADRIDREKSTIAGNQQWANYYKKDMMLMLERLEKEKTALKQLGMADGAKELMERLDQIKKEERGGERLANQVNDIKKEIGNIEKLMQNMEKETVDSKPSWGVNNRLQELIDGAKKANIRMKEIIGQIEGIEKEMMVERTQKEMKVMEGIEKEMMVERTQKEMKVMGGIKKDMIVEKAQEEMNAIKEEIEAEIAALKLRMPYEEKKELMKRIGKIDIMKMINVGGNWINEIKEANVETENIGRLIEALEKKIVELKLSEVIDPRAMVQLKDVKAINVWMKEKMAQIENAERERIEGAEDELEWIYGKDGVNGEKIEEMLNKAQKSDVEETFVTESIIKKEIELTEDQEMLDMLEEYSKNRILNNEGAKGENQEIQESNHSRSFFEIIMMMAKIVLNVHQEIMTAITNQKSRQADKTEI